MRKRTPGMYAYYKNESIKAMDNGDHERIGYLISDMPYEVLVELRNEGILPPRPDSDGLESVENSRKRTFKVEETFTVYYTRTLEYTIPSIGDDEQDEREVESMVDTPSFPTGFENGVILDYATSKIYVEPVELPEDRQYDLTQNEMALLERNFKEVLPLPKKTTNNLLSEGG
jgi:hypothetical protein